MKLSISIISAAVLACSLALPAYAKSTRKAYLGTPHGTVLSIKKDITDDAIVPPESFETDTKKMMENWYLQNYITLDADVEYRAKGTVSDDEYIRRLQAMPTAIEMAYNSIVRQYIDLYVEKRRTMMEQMLGMSLYYMPIFEQALEKEGIPMELKYLPIIESALNPEAVSRAGAAGLWQFMTSTALGLGLEVNSLVDERRDPLKASEKAAKYLKNLYNIYGDWSLVIAAYNCGPGNVNKAIRRAGGVLKDGKDYWDIYPYLPKETRGYVPAFIAANYAMTYFKLHNINASLARKPLLTDTIHVSKRVHFEQISQVLNIPMNELRVLNPQYRRDVIPGDNHPYALILPTQQIYSFIMSQDSIVNYKTELYGQRGYVEPATYQSEPQIDGDYTWETKTVTKYHTVKRKETLAKIARNYGVTTSSIKKANGLKSNSVSRGQKLKIYTTQRVKVPVPKQDEEPEAQNAESPTDADDAEAELGDITNEDGVMALTNNEQNTGELPEAIRKSSTATSRKASRPANQPKAEKPAEEQQQAAPAEKAERTAPTSHKVKKGETLTSIATQYGLTLKELQDANDITDGNIMVGERLTIPMPGQTAPASKESSREKSSQKSKKEPTTYTVKSGDNLGKIATAHGVTVEAIQDANDLRGNNIQVGQKLTIPSGNEYSRPKAAEPASITYTVKSGDNLDKIAKANGTTIDAIKEANNLRSTSLQVGQKLTIPAGNSSSRLKTSHTSSTTHKVKKGETLGKIAEKYGVSVQEIRNANGIKGSDLQIGDELTIPTTEKVSRKPSRKKRRR